jgi:hypothetical protein
MLRIWVPISYNIMLPNPCEINNLIAQECEWNRPVWENKKLLEELRFSQRWL